MKRKAGGSRGSEATEKGGKREKGRKSKTKQKVKRTKEGERRNGKGTGEGGRRRGKRKEQAESEVVRVQDRASRGVTIGPVCQFFRFLYRPSSKKGGSRGAGGTGTRLEGGEQEGVAKHAGCRNIRTRTREAHRRRENSHKRHIAWPGWRPCGPPGRGSQEQCGGIQQWTSRQPEDPEADLHLRGELRQRRNGGFLVSTHSKSHILQLGHSSSSAQGPSCNEMAENRRRRSGVLVQTSI